MRLGQADTRICVFPGCSFDPNQSQALIISPIQALVAFCSSLGKLTRISGPSIVRMTYRRGITDEDSRAGRRGTRTRAGLEIKKELARGKNLWRPGKWRHACGTGMPAHRPPPRRP